MRSNKLNHILKPQGKASIVISLLSALIFILLFNFLIYQYLIWQSPSTALPNSKWGWAFGSVKSFAGIKNLKSPVDTLLLGDSTCDKNLDTGPFADRLGGQVLNLGNINETSFLMDAWMLGRYIDRFGPPRNVVVCRSAPLGYQRVHNVEFMAVVHLPWNYWDRYAPSPAWQANELKNLALTRYGVIYSDADILRDRLLKPWKLFDFGVQPKQPSHDYVRGSTDPQGIMDVGQHLPDFYFAGFNATTDTTTAFRYMTNLARARHFQLYLAYQPEWDKAIQAGARVGILDAQTKYLTQFIDPVYVHILRDPSLTFQKDQFESPNHLRPGADRILTESDVQGMVSIQNQQTAGDFQPLDLISVTLDKNEYHPGDIPTIILTVMNRGQFEIIGGVSCLIRPNDKPDREWTARAQAVDLDLPPGAQNSVNLKLNVEKINRVGGYDLIVFLRQNIGRLSHETRIEIKNKISIR